MSPMPAWVWVMSFWVIPFPRDQRKCVRVCFDCHDGQWGGHWHLEGKDWNAKYSKNHSAWNANSALVETHAWRQDHLFAEQILKRPWKARIEVNFDHIIILFFWVETLLWVFCTEESSSPQLFNYVLDALG